jgi:hypothetical protein
MQGSGRVRGPAKLSHEFAKVSALKPVGYETLGFLAGECGLDPCALRQELEARGLKTMMLTGPDCAMRSGALYAYDEKALAAFLESRAAVLAASEWPATPEAFIRRIAVDWAPEKTPLFDTIADAFNNKAHPGRTDVNVPEEDTRWNPEYLAYLRERARESGKAPVPGRKPRL